MYSFYFLFYLDEYQNNELPFKHLTSVEKCFYADFLDHVTFHGASVTITPEILHVLHKYNVWLEGRNRREERGGGGYRKCEVYYLTMKFGRKSQSNT